MFKNFYRRNSFFNTMKNEFGIDFDWPGFCANCHLAVAEFEGSDEHGILKIKKMLGNARAVYFHLGNGSQMPVTLCETCELNLKGSDCKNIMESIINGWQMEIDLKCSHWEDKKKTDYMDTYSKHTIIQRIDKPFPSVELNDIKKPDTNNLKIKIKVKK